jgi:hypothetical protein
MASSMAISRKKTGVARTMIWLGLMEDIKNVH